MACQIQTDKYNSVVLNLIKLDPSVYNNFDNAAKFILNSSLTPEQKMLSVHNMAYIYKGLSGIDSKFYNAGNAENVMGAVSFMDDVSNYVSEVSVMFGLKKPSKLKVESINKAIDALSTKKNITRLDLISQEGILTAINNYFSITSFPTNDERESLIDDFQKVITDTINDHTTDQVHKDFLIKQVLHSLDSLRMTSSFVSLSEIAALADLNNVLVTLTNGQMVEALREDEQFKRINDDGTLTIIPLTEILSAKDARVADNSKSNAGEQVFQQHTLLSSFSIKAVDSADQFELEKKLSNMKNTQAGIKIHAVKLSNVADRRVQRIQEVASENVKYAGLEKRQHETFENATQTAALKSSPNKKVMTVSRPKSSEQQFVLVGEIIGTGEKFYLYSSDNFVFVNSDNSTERVDFSKPEHQDLIKALAVKNTKQGNESLSDSDIAKIAESSNLYNAFKTKLSEQLTNQYEAGATSVDVTSEFFDSYDASGKRSNIRTSRRLKDAIVTNPALVKTLQVVTVINGTEVTKTETIDIPFIYNKVGDTYVLRSVLNSNQRILDLEGKQHTQQSYAEQVIGVFEDKVLGSVVKPEHGNQNNIILTFKDAGKINYMTINPLTSQMESKVEFAKFVIDLSNTLLNNRALLTTNEYGKNNYTFKVKNNNKTYQGQNQKQAPFYVNLALSNKDVNKGTLQVEIRATGNEASNDYKFINDSQNKQQFNFPIDEKKIHTLADSFKGNGQLTKEVKEAYPALKNLDLNNPKDLETFFDAVETLSQNETALPVIKKLAKAIEQSQETFAEMLITSVVDKLESRTTMFPGFMDNLKRDFTTNGVFRPEWIVADTTSDGLLIPRIKSSLTKNSDKYYKNTFNMKIVEADYKRFTIVPKAIAPAIVQEQVLAPITVAEKIHEQEDVKVTQIESSDLPDIEVFSLTEDANVTVETDEERLSSVEWLRQNLPQFGIDNVALEELISLMQLNGTVLGAFKDKVIYLNDALKGKGVVYHEAFHGVFRHLLNAEERNNLIDAVTGVKKNASQFTEAALKEFARQRNYSFTLDVLKRLKAEEILADGFQNYMLNNTKPKGIIGQLMALLKKLLEMFSKNSSYIDNVYGNIKTGQYKNEVISSGMFEGQFAYKLIDGIRQVSTTSTGMVGESTSTLSRADQDQLVNMLAGYMLEDGQKESFTTKFDRIAKYVLDYEYNLDVLLALPDNAKMIASDPGLKDRILSTMGPLYTNYRFMLGARVNGEKLFDINTTGNPAYDGRVSSKNMIIVPGEEPKDNSLGKVSYEMLRDLVKEKVDSINSILDSNEKFADNDVMQKEMSGANENVISDDDAELDSETSESVDYDSSFNEINAESLPRMIRKYLTIVRYDQVHPQLGIKVPRMIPGEQIFSSLLQTSADIEPSNIIEHIKITGEGQIEDGFYVMGNDILAIYNKLSRETGMESDGVPTKNKQLYNMVIDVLHKTAVDYVMIKPKTVLEEIDPQSNETNLSTTGFTIIDQVFKQDVDNKKKDFLTSIIKTYKENKNNKEYLSQVKELVKLSKKMTSPFILTEVSTQNTQLERLTNELYEAFNNVGLKFPKSLIRMSIMAIDQTDNKVDLNVTGKAKSHYDAHSRFVSEKKYLERDFFFSVNDIFDKIVQGISTNDFAVELDNNNSKDKSINRFNTIIKKASEYIVKYDLSNILPTVRNAEGKPIYRYVSNTPVTLLFQSIRSKGLLATLEDDPFYKDFLKDFFFDNAALTDLLNNEDTPRARETKLLLDNLNVALFGGVSQTVGTKIKDGKSFKNIDKKSLYITQYLAFIKRTTHSSFKKEADSEGNVSDVVTNIQTYQRSFSQLEASQTNYLVTGLYKPFANAKGKVLNSDKRLKIVDTFEDVIKQEYKRIAKEWARSEQNKKDFDSGKQAPILNNYNGVLDNEDKSKVNTELKDLRAYKFNKLADFFTENPEIESNVDKNGLADFAKQGVTYNELDPAIKEALLNSLNNYAQTQLDKHLKNLVDLKVLTKKTIVRHYSSGKPEIDARTGEPKAPITYYDSAFIPTKIVVNNVPETLLSNAYQPTEETYSASKDKIQNANLEGLATDFFFNNWMNALYFNEIINGDIAMNIKDSTDYFKRNKKLLAAGSTMKEGYHRVAYLNTIKGFISDNHPEYGPYYSKQAIINDTTIKSSEIKEQLLSEFGSKKTMRDIFDGQSITTLMHQIDMHDSMGRLSSDILYSLIAKHYRTLSETEIRMMEAGKVVNNPKKTITASRNSYHKQSENLIDRLDVSILVPKSNQSLTQAQDTLHGLYMNLYSLRAERQELVKAKEINQIESLDTVIKKTVEDIHEYFRPLPHRKVLHDLLNSMEYHQIDQLMDTTASKNATRLPLDYFSAAEKINETDGYLNLALSSMDIDNKYKFLQVETSGVKDKAKFSVQSKMLIAADVINLNELIKAKGIKMSASEEKALNKITETLVEYQSSLKKIGQSNLATLKTILRKDGDFQVGKIFELISASLEEQGANTATLKLFDLDASGKPVHSANLPGIRNMLEYYFFSQYSKHVTDEKGSGTKSIHISSWGMNVLADENNEVVSTENYKNNPEGYGLLKERPLGVSIEIDKKTGVKTYFIEAIMPKPLFKSKEHEAFYMKNLLKMFGVRIPTEDKRSMVAIKVVDFMDSSNLNGIILPHLVHLLAGSDFDVDALYSQTFAHYFDLSGNPKLYGEYEGGQNTNLNKFAEFVQYMSKDQDMRPLIKKELKKLLNETSYDVSENVLDVLYHSGFDESDFNGAMNFSELKESYESNKSDIKELMDIRDEAREEFVDAIKRNEINPSDRSALDDRRALGKEVGEYNKELVEKRGQKNEYGRQVSRANRFLDGGLKATAILNVFSKMGLPASAQAFEANPNYALSVRPIFQNLNLQSKLDIMSNEVVYKYLYVNERSSIERFEQIVDNFGLNLDEYSTMYNMYTPDAVIASKVDTSMFKDGIGIAANTNKFVALASQYGLGLKSENVIWSFKNADLEQVYLNKFGTINADNERVIAVVGNILGMFADGAKKPIPAVLQMNEVNTGITLAMIGVGLSPEFAIAFNFIPEIRKAVQEVQAGKYAITESLSTSYTYLGKEIGNQIKDIATSNKDALSNLIKAGLIDPSSNPYKIILNKEKLVVDFKAGKLNTKSILENTLRADEIGFEVSAMIDITDKATDLEETTNRIQFTDAEQKIILLQLYKDQANQTYSIRKAGSMIDLFKKLNPSFTNFDRLFENIKTLRGEESIFTPESVEKIFDENQVWPELFEALEDLNEQASKLFLERTQFFAPIKKAFDSVFVDKANIAKVITSYVALKQYQKNMPGSRKTGTSMDALIEQDDKNLVDTFTPEYWFTNTLPEQLEEFQKKYSNNKFLQLLRPDISENKAFLTSGGYVNERSIKMINKSKISGNLSDEISDDASFLLRNENMFTKKLFYHELAKTGLQYKAGSFLQYLDPGMMIPLSNYIDSFISKLEETKGDKNKLIDVIKDLIGKEATDKDVYEFFDQLFLQMAYAATKEVGNSNIKIATGFSSSLMSNIMKSFNFDAEQSETSRRIILNNVLNRFSGQELKNAKTFRLLSEENQKPVEEIIFNMDVPKDIKEATKETMDEIGKKVSITFDKFTNKYNFPLIISVGFKKYLLNGVDSEIENNSFGKSVINSIVGKGEYVNQGYTAKYTLIPDQLTTGSLSSIGFTKEAAKTYMDYVSGKKKLEYIAPEIKKSEETVAMLPESTVKQTVSKSQLEIDMENLELTDSVINALYNESSKRMSIEEFKTAAQGVIVNLRAVMSNEQILEKIKCL